jgi:hypothetical protein
MAVLIQAIDAHATTLKITEVDAASFPKDNGMLQIDGELISYETTYMGTFEKCVRGVNKTPKSSHPAQSLVMNATGTVDKSRSKVRSLTIYLLPGTTVEKINDYKKSLHQFHLYSRHWKEVKGTNGIVTALTVMVKDAQLSEVMTVLNDMLAGASIVIGDAKEPTCTIVDPAYLSEVTGIITLQAVVSDKKVVRIDYKKDDTLIGTSSIFPYSVNYDTAGLPAGNIDFVAYAYDKNGRLLGQSALFTLLIPGQVVGFDGTNLDTLLTQGFSSDLVSASTAEVAGALEITSLDTPESDPTFGGYWSLLGTDLLPTVPEEVYLESKQASSMSAYGTQLTIANGNALDAIVFLADGVYTYDPQEKIGDYSDGLYHIYKIILRADGNTEWYIDGDLKLTRPSIPHTWNAISIAEWGEIGNVTKVDYIRWGVV